MLLATDLGRSIPEILSFVINIYQTLSIFIKIYQISSKSIKFIKLWVAAAISKDLFPGTTHSPDTVVSDAPKERNERCCLLNSG